ncbi:hypothetical protein GCM10020000_86360 [Streptomyces olivoverticillatus]
MSEQATNLYAFIADRLDEEMRQQYGADGTCGAVHQYADQLRDAMAAHHAYVNAREADQEAVAARCLQELTERAACWPDHPEHPLRAAA